MKFRQSIRGLVLKLPSPLFKTIINFYYKLSTSKVKILSEEKSIIKLFDESQITIYIKIRDRIVFYKKGIEHRLEQLLEDYCVNQIDFVKDDVVIDCGANIGEFGLGLIKKNKEIKYYGFEPDSNIFECLEFNLPDHHKIKKGLWNSTGESKFYFGTNSADSSIIEHPNASDVGTIEVITLDEWMKSVDLKRIKLLKIEAEGGEPEVLKGSLSSLSQVEFITIDCGYERGLTQESTATEVSNLLYKANFELIKINLVRGTFLFKNKAFE